MKGEERLTNEKITESCARRAVAVKHLGLGQRGCEIDAKLDTPTMTVRLISAAVLLFLNLLIFFAARRLRAFSLDPET